VRTAGLKQQNLKTNLYCREFKSLFTFSSLLGDGVFLAVCNVVPDVEWKMDVNCLLSKAHLRFSVNRKTKYQRQYKTSQSH